jgi:hypothetical protein
MSSSKTKTNKKGLDAGGGGAWICFGGVCEASTHIKLNCKFLSVPLRFQMTSTITFTKKQSQNQNRCTRNGGSDAAKMGHKKKSKIQFVFLPSLPNLF